MLYTHSLLEYPNHSHFTDRKAHQSLTKLYKFLQEVGK